MNDDRHRDTLLLTRHDVRALLSMRECIEALDAAFGAEGRGELAPSGVLGTHVAGGGFHVKSAGARLLAAGAGYFAAKINANFPANPIERGLPTIQGVVALFALDSGRVLAVMDSIEITALRTAAATAVAARYLARADARSATIIGCGVQGRSQLRALACVRDLRRVTAVDQSRDAAQLFAADMSRELGVAVEVGADLHDAARASDIVVTCTTARRPLLSARDVRAGCFVAGVGADSETKHELAADLLASSTVVVDSLEQCATIGDLHHALDAGAMRREDVHAQLGEVVAGRRAARTRDDETIIFDSTGIALEDVAAAARVYERARDAGRGAPIDFGA